MSHTKLNFDFENTTFKYNRAPNNMETWKVNTSNVPTFTTHNDSSYNRNKEPFYYNFYDTSDLAAQIYFSTEQSYNSNSDLCG